MCYRDTERSARRSAQGRGEAVNIAGVGPDSGRPVATAATTSQRRMEYGYGHDDKRQRRIKRFQQRRQRNIDVGSGLVVFIRRRQGAFQMQRRVMHMVTRVRRIVVNVQTQLHSLGKQKRRHQQQSHRTRGTSCKKSERHRAAE